MQKYYNNMPSILSARMGDSLEDLMKKTNFILLANVDITLQWLINSSDLIDHNFIVPHILKFQVDIRKHFQLLLYNDYSELKSHWTVCR